MIIGPPFLPSRAGLTTDGWLNIAMNEPPILQNTGAPEGAFPLSHQLAWHNGLHLEAPTVNGVALSVRAIADGKVIYVHPPAAMSSDPSHPQNYDTYARGAATTARWTDNGCLILAHKTEIGASAGTTTVATFYSLYMHLSAIGKTRDGGTRLRALRAGDAVSRKDDIGTSGHLYGRSGQIHFEICCDNGNLNRLLGRDPNWVAPCVAPQTLPAPTVDGRIDCLFGSIYFYLPASTAIERGNTLPPSARPTGGVAEALGTEAWIRMTYAAGACTLETFDACGKVVGTAPAEVDGEYRLADHAAQRHDALPAAVRAQSSPSGWFELLRFGRVVGRGAGDREPLPAEAAHWRRIRVESGEVVWADLNSPGTCKMSDADFLPAMGWNCIDDDSSPTDQRCDSEHMKMLLRDTQTTPSAPDDPQSLASRLGLPAVRARLKRAICRFPSEWNQLDVAKRYSFVQERDDFKESSTAWSAFHSHLLSITFPDLPDEYLQADWHWNPREFVTVFSQCGWLSGEEFAQIYTSTPEPIRNTYLPALNIVTRKYLYASTPVRLSHFLGQGSIESNAMRTMQEASMIGRVQGDDFFGSAINPVSRRNESELGHWYGAIPSEDDAWFRSNKHNSHGTLIASSYNWRNGNLGDPDAQKFRGRGFKQLTGLLNYSRYWVYRGWLSKSTFDDNWWTDPAYRSHQPTRMRLRPPVVNDPERATVTPFNCLDTGGWYLGSERPDTLRQIDQDSLEVAITQAERAAEQTISYAVTHAINGGGIQRDDRLRETRVAKEVLL